MLGIIGGSGLYDLPGMELVDRVLPDTPTVSQVMRSSLGGSRGARLPFSAGTARSPLTPTELPYQANIYALKEIGVTRVVTISAVGSLRESLPPRTAVLPDDHRSHRFAPAQLLW